MIKLIRTTSTNPDFPGLIRELDKDLRGRYNEAQSAYDAYNKVEGIDTVVIAYDGDEPAGCGCFKKFDDEAVEIKRMFVSSAKRNLGIASSILHELEAWARELQYTHTVLETGTRQTEAIALYKKMGYTVVPNYGQYIDLPFSICMKKTIAL